MATNNMTIMCERLTKLETENNHQSEKIDEIHKILVGNGKPGLLAEWNQWKGAARLFNILVGFSITALGIILGVFIKK